MKTKYGNRVVSNPKQSDEVVLVWTSSLRKIENAE